MRVFEPVTDAAQLLELSERAARLYASLPSGPGGSGDDPLASYISAVRRPFVVHREAPSFVDIDQVTLTGIVNDSTYIRARDSRVGILVPDALEVFAYGTELLNDRHVAGPWHRASRNGSAGLVVIHGGLDVNIRDASTRELIPLPRSA